MKRSWKSIIADTVTLPKTFNVNINHILFANIKIKHEIVIGSNEVKYICIICRFPCFGGFGIFSRRVWSGEIARWRAQGRSSYKCRFLAGRYGRYVDFQIRYKTMDYNQNIAYVALECFRLIIKCNNNVKFCYATPQIASRTLNERILSVVH